jgi:hypothetical protein
VAAEISLRKYEGKVFHTEVLQISQAHNQWLKKLFTRKDQKLRCNNFMVQASSHKSFNSI